jgi:hypothetical protein
MCRGPRLSMPIIACVNECLPPSASLLISLILPPRLQRGVRTVIVAGMLTSCCVCLTACSLFARGFRFVSRVTFALTCTTSPLFSFKPLLQLSQNLRFGRLLRRQEHERSQRDTRARKQVQDPFAAPFELTGQQTKFRCHHSG